MSIGNLLEEDYPDHIILIFIDGIGIGKFDRIINPFAQNEYQIFNAFDDQTFPRPTIRNGFVLGLDTDLEVDGLPQSATGQTSLFTGVNASKRLGRHLSRFPNEELRGIIKEYSLLKLTVFFRPPWLNFFINEEFSMLYGFCISMFLIRLSR